MKKIVLRLKYLTIKYINYKMPQIIKDEKKFIELMDIIYEQYHKVRDERDKYKKELEQLKLKINNLTNN